MPDMEDLNNKWTNYLDEILKAGVPIYYLNNEGDLVVETSGGNIKKLERLKRKYLGR